MSISIPDTEDKGIPGKGVRSTTLLDKYLSKRNTAAEAVSGIRSGDCVYIHPGCAEPGWM
jgi:hypothetical protein